MKLSCYYLGPSLGGLITLKLGTSESFPKFYETDSDGKLNMPKLVICLLAENYSLTNYLLHNWFVSKVKYGWPNDGRKQNI